MKTQRYNQKAAWVAIGLALGASLLMTGPQAATAEETKQDKGFMEKMERWQDKMSETFRDTWRGLRGDARHKSAATASVDLREDKDHYRVRLNLPDRDLDKVEVKLEGETLRILAPSQGSVGRYEQTLKLENVAPIAAPKIERNQKDSMIVVTVAKKVTDPEDKVATTPPESSTSSLSDWDRDIFERMNKMRLDMDHIFEDAFREFRPDHKGFFDEPRFGSSVDLKEEGDAYVVRAYLPDRDLQFINVAVEDRILKIEAKEQTSPKHEESGRSGKLHTMQKAAYSQFITLPGPVQAEKMKVDRKTGLLIVTLPKAS